MHLQPEENIYYISLHLDAFITAFKVQTKGAIWGKKQLGVARPHCIGEGLLPLKRLHKRHTDFNMGKTHTSGACLRYFPAFTLFLRGNLKIHRIEG